MEKTIRFLGLGAIFFAALWGCNGGSSGSSTASGTAGKHLKLAFVTNNSSDYWTIAHKGVDKATKDLNDAAAADATHKLPTVEVDFRMPADGSAAGQKQIIDDLIASGVDGIAISPVDPANETDMINNAAKSALVFTQDSDAPNSNRACYIGTDNVAAGKMLGEEIKKALPNGGRIYAFVGKSDAQNAKDRLQGVQQAIAGTKIQLIDTIQDGADHTKAKTNVADILVKDPNVAGLIGIWSYNGPAIYSAVQDANKVGKVKILCFDEEVQTLDGIKKGAIDATIVQQPYQFGYLAITNMSKYLNGDKSVIPANKLDNVDPQVVDKANVDDYKAKMDKIRAE